MAALFAPDAGLIEELGDDMGAEDELPAAAGLVDSEVLPPQAAVDRARPVTAANRTRARFMTGSFRDGWWDRAAVAGSVGSHGRDRDGVPAGGPVGFGRP